MKIRFYNAKILQTHENHTFSVLDGELWVEGQKITFVGTANEAAGRKPPCWEREFDVQGNLLMPGFKDAHTHTPMTFLRSFADDLPLKEWLHQKVFPQEALLTKEAAYWFSLLGIMEYLTSGITSGFDMYFLTKAVTKAVADSGFRMVQTSGVNDFASSPEEMEEEYWYVNELCDRTSYLVGFHAEYTTSLEKMRSVAAVAEKLKSPVWFHNAETKQEVEDCKKRYGMTPTQLAEELQMFNHGGGGYHCIWLEEDDFEIFKRRNLTVVTNPASNLKLASGICPVKRLVDEGISVAVGTDGPASNNCLDMFREMFLVAALAKVREMDAKCVAAEEVLYMATTGGSQAMGLFDCDGLAEGKCADIIIIDLEQPNMQPQHNIVKNLVYSGSKQNVKMTMVDGRILYEDGKFDIGFAPEEIYRRAAEFAGKL